MPQAPPPESGWDPAILKQAQRELARVVGPVASLMVKRAAATATDVGMLYGILAENLNDHDRAEFLQAGPTPSPPAASQPSATHWDPEVLKRVEHQLAHLVGPIAGSMVRRAAAHTRDLDELYFALGDQLGERDERALYDGRDSLVEALPPKNPIAIPPPQVPAALPAANAAQPRRQTAAVLKQVEQKLVGFVDPIARSLAGRCAAGTTAIHNAYHSLAQRLVHKTNPVLPEAQTEVPKAAEAALHPMVAAQATPVEARPARVARRDRLRTLPSRVRRSKVSRLITGRERLRVRLAPGEVLAGGRSIPCDPALGAEPWQGAVATLKAFEWNERCEVTAVLSNHFVRYAVVPWSDALSSAAEEEAYLRHHFAKIHGERAKSWTARASEDRRGVPRLASAIDTALLEELKSAFPRDGKASLVSVQPELMEAINRWRDAIPHEGAWLVLAEPERACLAMYKDGGWRSVQNAKGEWLTLLERERLRSHGGLHEVPALVLLSGAAAPKESEGWQFRELAA